MSLKFNSVMIGAEDSHKLGEFYKKVLGQTMEWSDGSQGWYGWDVGGNSVAIGPHSEVHGQNPQPARIMLTFETTDVKGEFERIKAAGAKVVAEPYHPGMAGDDNQMMLATLADPEGNYFQLSSPWEPPKK